MRAPFYVSFERGTADLHESGRSEEPPHGGTAMDAFTLPTAQRLALRPVDRPKMPGSSRVHWAGNTVTDWSALVTQACAPSEEIAEGMSNP